MNIALMTIGLEPIPPRPAHIPPPPNIDDDELEPAETPPPAAGKAAAIETDTEKPLKRPEQKTQRLLHAITREGPITTSDLAASEGMSTRMVWGLLRYHLMAGTVRRIDDRWHAGTADPAVAAALRLLHKRGWTCTPPGEHP